MVGTTSWAAKALAIGAAVSSFVPSVVAGPGNWQRDPVVDVQVKHNGTSVGEYKNITGVQTYITKPKGYKNGNAILYIVDAYGLPLAQNRLLADSFTRAGYLVVAPDIFRGDPSPSDLATPNFNSTAWRARHPPDDIDRILNSTLKYIRGEAGVKKVAAVGYCFGGRYVVRYLAKGKGLDAGFIAHPSLLTEDEVKGVKLPISYASAETDTQWNSTQRHWTEEVFKNASIPYQISLYGGTSHGFGVRANISDPRQKYAKEEAYLQAVRWFDSWL